MSEILLSICIPTYNRAGYLQKCLKGFFSQLSNENKSLIEVYISNNASPDNTHEVVSQFIREGHKIRYNVNSENIGPDRNIASCFANAKGKYAWVFSDDDFVLPGYLDQIIKLLQNNDVGIVHMNSLWYDDENEIVIQAEELKYTCYDKQISFFRAVNYWITFASGNIINKKSLQSQDWINQFKETNLTQLSWMIPAIFNNKINILINNKVLACKANNTGGYNFIKVFGKNFNSILDFYIDHGYDREIKKIININLINSFFPQFVKPGLKQKGNRRNLFDLIPIFWKYPDFWKVYLILPLTKMMRN